MFKNKSGFTIVELLIVIVVIAILATISVVAYNGIQQRARDAQRLQDVKTIEKALRLYLVQNGSFPYATSTDGSGHWERSYNEPNGQFMEFLNPMINNVPRDPANTSSATYYYHVFSPGAYGCDATKGKAAVFMIGDMETSGRPHTQSPTINCPTRNWNGEGDYVIRVFEND